MSPGFDVVQPAASNGLFDGGCEVEILFGPGGAGPGVAEAGTHQRDGGPECVGADGQRRHPHAQPVTPHDGVLGLLKIDVEGFERNVLQGMDFQRWRPWIILIEAAFDKTPEWEELILQAGYQPALCDGINRYYVAQEKLELLVPLSMPPNFLDEFQLCYGHRFSHPVADIEPLKVNLQKATQRADLAETQLAAIYNSRLWKVARLITSLKRLIATR